MATKRPSTAPRKRTRAPDASPWAAPAGVVSAPGAAPPPQPPVATDSAPSDAPERIRAAASRGGSLKAMHALFAVPAEVFAGWLKADPTLRAAHSEGVELERQALHRTLLNAAVYKQDLNAAQFLLKHHHGYAPASAPTKSKVDVNVTARGGVMVLPPETSLEEWEKQTAQAQAELKQKVRD